MYSLGIQTFGPCVVCPSVIDGLWLPLLVSSNFWPLCFLSFWDWRSLVIPFDIYKLLTLCCLSFCDWRSLITPFGFFKLLALVFSFLLWLTVFDYPFWFLQTCGPSVVCPSVIDVSDYLFWFLHTLGPCVVCPSVIDGLWLPLWFLQTFGTCVVCPSVIDGLWLPLFVSSNFWLLCCLSFCDWRSLIISFGFFKLSALVLSGLQWLTVSGYLFWYLQTFDPCVVCPSVIDGLWLSLLVSSNFRPLYCLAFCDWRSLVTSFGIFKRLTLVLSALLRITASDYPFGIFKLLFMTLLFLLLNFISLQCLPMYAIWFPVFGKILYTRNAVVMFCFVSMIDDMV